MPRPSRGAQTPCKTRGKLFYPAIGLILLISKVVRGSRAVPSQDATLTRCAPQRRSIWRNKKDHFGRANLFYIDEQEIITYTAGVMIEVAVLEFHALACQASWSLDAGISLNAAETSFRRFSTCRIFGSVC
jgi:hypothetical protein